MANISTYANSTPVTTTSKFLGTDENNDTANFQASDVAVYVLGSATTITTVTANPYTITLTDLNTFMRYGTNGGVINTPASTDTSFPIGGEVKIQLTVSGTCTPTAGSGITLQGATTTLTVQYQVKTLKRISATVWTLY
jgi:hypothetical protein